MTIVDEVFIGMGSNNPIQSSVVDERQWNAITVSGEIPPVTPSWLWIGGGIAILIGAAVIGKRIQRMKGAEKEK
jgi:phosphate/sulfate permease